MRPVTRDGLLILIFPLGALVLLRCVLQAMTATRTQPLDVLAFFDDRAADIAAKRAAGQGPWDLRRVFSDEPPGAYIGFMRPLLYANHITYSTAPRVRQTAFFDPTTATIIEEYSGGRRWERLYGVEDDPVEGPHMRAFVDHEARRAILAFRGSCYEKLLPGCRADMAIFKGGKPGPADYIRMAVDRVNAAQRHLASISSDYAVVVTGHSLGAYLARGACLHSAWPCQVVAFGGGLGEFTIEGRAHNQDDVLLFDPLDLHVHRSNVSYRTAGPSTLCVYDMPTPPSCRECAAEKLDLAAASESELYAAYQACRETGRKPPGHPITLCYEDTHMLDPWVRDVLPLKDSGKPRLLPACRVYTEETPSGAPFNTLR